MLGSSSGLGHRPLTAVTGVRLPYRVPSIEPYFDSKYGFFLFKSSSLITFETDYGCSMLKLQLTGKFECDETADWVYKKAPTKGALLFGGKKGIRTLDTVPRIHDFQSCALDQTQPSFHTLWRLIGNSPNRAYVWYNKACENASTFFHFFIYN